MNFFTRQEKARRRTWLLMLLFCASLLCMILLTTLLFTLVFSYGAEDPGGMEFSPTELTGFFLTACMLVIPVVAIASLFKLAQLRRGGQAVAEMLGGRLVLMETTDPDERKLLNVVEEMAIASGSPVPQVYLMNEESINAFAAGYKPGDAVIGVTRGAVRRLTRDELQGVIAHEFSHIFNGDMRLNIRLMGVLYGILVLSLLGFMLMRGAAFSRGRKNNGAAALLAVGLGLVVIGYAGNFFGALIKAAVSRQREFLADASAVQFTRNPTGIAGALKKIGGLAAGSRIANPKAAELSHMYFGQAVSSFWGGIMATHPPLRERIQRIEPGWDGEFQTDVAEVPPGGDPAAAPPSAAAAPATFATAELVAGGGAGNTEQIDLARLGYARTLLDKIPPRIRESAQNPFAARALIYCLLLDKQDDAVRQRQWEQLETEADPAVYRLAQQLSGMVALLEPELHLPLVDLCMPSLRRLSSTQYQVFKANLLALIHADQRVYLFEWTTYRLVVDNLENKPSGNAHSRLAKRSSDCRILLGALAHSGQSTPDAAARAFAAAMRELGFTLLLPERKDCTLEALDKAVTNLNSLKPRDKERLLGAMECCIQHDYRIAPREAELFRALSASLGCPIPLAV